MYETELTVVVLDQEENRLGSLHPRYVDIEETNELYALRTIRITHPLVDDNNQDLSKYDQLLTAGNKIWQPSNSDGEPCLYVLIDDKEYDFKNLIVTMTAEEVAGELSQFQLNRSSAFSWVVNSSFINTYISNLFTAGTLTGPSTETTTQGVYTPMAMLQEIMKNVSGEFQFRYELDDNNKIERYIDFVPQIGKTINTPIELGYNTLDITLNISEADVRIAAGPGGQSDNADSTFHKSHKEFENIFVTAGYQIQYSALDENGDPYPTLKTAPYTKLAGQKYVECNNQSELVANYQRINRRANAVREDYYDDFEDNKYTGRTAPYVDWTVGTGTPAMESGSPLSGTYSIKHTGNGSNAITNIMKQTLSEHPYRVDFKFKLTNQGSGSLTPYALLWVVRYTDANNYVKVDTAYDTDSGFQRLRLVEVVNGNITILDYSSWIGGKLGTSTTYDFTIWDDGHYINVAVNGVLKLGYQYTANSGLIVGFGANVNCAGLWDNINIQYRNDYPRIHVFDSDETNAYNMYWECVDALKEVLKPSIEITANVVDLKKLMGETPTYFNVGDTVSIRLPGHDDLVTARITGTTKNPRSPGEDTVEISNVNVNFMNTFLGKFFKSPGDITL